MAKSVLRWEDNVGLLKLSNIARRLTVAVRKIDVIYFLAQRLVRRDDDVVVRQGLRLHEALFVNAAVNLQET